MEEHAACEGVEMSERGKPEESAEQFWSTFAATYPWKIRAHIDWNPDKWMTDFAEAFAQHKCKELEESSEQLTIELEGVVGDKMAYLFDRCAGALAINQELADLRAKWNAAEQECERLR